MDRQPPSARGEEVSGDELAESDTVHASAPSEAPAPAGEPLRLPGRGETIERFVVLGTLGTGGMGVVLSVYDPQLDRRIAVKLLRPEAVVAGADDEARSRLLREAQAMAKISHPNVITVHEVGTFGDQVFLAMEYVEGGTLKTWQRAEPRKWPEVVELYTQAARGLAAAHRAGLVHRDFKPDNVLIGDDGRARVTDFGLVGLAGESGGERDDAPIEAVDQHHSGSTPLSQHLTRTGSVMGTPSYMAPEQFRGVSATPQTDQFSFCVALYEGLYGERPFTGASLAELADNVLSAELPEPPREISVPSWLRRVLARGLSRRPEDRYESMEALLAELTGDHGAGRRRWAIAAAGVVAVGALVGLIAMRSGSPVCGGGAAALADVWGPEQRAAARAAFEASGRPHAAATFDRLVAALDSWGHAWTDAYADACEDTHVRGVQSGAALDLRMACLDRSLGEFADFARRLGAADGEVVDHALDAATKLPGVAACADTEALSATTPPPDDPAARERIDRVREQLGETRNLRRLGQYDEALARAKELEDPAREIGHAPLLGEVLWLTGQLTTEAGESGADDILREAARTAAAGRDDETFAGALADLIHVLGWELAEYDAAMELARVTEAVVERTGASPETAVRMHNHIGYALAKRGELKEAEARHRRALALAEEAFGPDDRRTITALSGLGNALKDQERYDDARATLERVLAARERTFGKKHPDVANALNNLGTVARRQGEYDEALALLERALKLRVEALGPEHPEVGTAHLNLGTVYGDRKEHVKAEEHYRRALELWEAHYGPDHPDVGMALLNIGSALQNQGKLEEARVQLERALALWEKTYGPEDARIAGPVSNLGLIHKELGDLDAARESFERAIEITEKSAGPEHSDMVGYLGNLATILVRQDDLDGAIATVRRSLGIAEKVLGDEHPRVGMMNVNLAIYLLEDDRPAEAEPHFRRSLAIFEAKFGAEHVYTAYPLTGLGLCLVELGRPAEAISLLERAVAIREEHAAGSNMVPEARFALGRALVESGKDRRRGLAAVRTAVREWSKIGDGSGADEARTWLRRH